MASSVAERSPFSAWLARVEVERRGVIALGLLLAGGLTAAMCLWWAVFGLWDTLFDATEPFGISHDARNHFIIVWLLSFVWVGSRWAGHEEARALAAFGRRSTLPPEIVSAEIHRADRLTPTARIVSIVFALFVGIMMLLLTNPPAGDRLSLVSDPHAVWAIVTNVLLFVVMAHGAYHATARIKTLARLLHSLPEIDLLDREELARIGRFGFPGALVWLVGSTIASTLAWGMQTIWPLIVVICATLCIATFALMRPAQIFYARIDEAKRNELERVRARIARARDAALGLDGDAARAEREASMLTGLLAYEDRIESVRQWVFDLPTLLRFGALALLAVGSWLGGAVVERVLGVILE